MPSTAVSVLDYIFLSLTSLSSTTLWLSAVAGAAVAYYFYKNRCPDDWTRYGVKCPKLPWSTFFGIDFRVDYTKLFQQYGDIIGFHGKDRLVMLTTNFDLLRNILLKDFNNFVDRGDELPSSSPFGKSLFFAKGLEWRRHRLIVSPTFSSGKLKNISNSVAKSAEYLTEYLEKCAKNKQLVPIKELTGQYTCEIIAKTAFGLDVKFIGQDDVEFYNYTKNMLRIKNRTGVWKLIFNFLISIPYLAKLTMHVLNMQYFDPINVTANKYFGVTVKNTITERRQQQNVGVKRSRVDFLDLLLKANDAAAAGQLKATEEEFMSADRSQEGKFIKGFSDEEMTGQSMLVIFAGMETTATTLQMCLYELAANPDVQEKVLQEITAVVTSETPTPEELNSLTYTEQVINETLRLYTPVPIVNRSAKETRTYNGVTIPKGTFVIIPYFHILQDPKVFPDPEKFDPDRFSSEAKAKRDPLSFSAFGHGPRLCLGMRLAYLELKQGLVHVLRKLRVVLNENTEPKKGSSGVTIAPSRLVIPEKTIMLAFELREGTSSMWTLNKQTEDIINAFEMWNYRRLGRISRKEKQTNKTVLEKLGMKKELLKELNIREIKCLRHIKRHNTLRKPILEGRVEDKRTREREGMNVGGYDRGWRVCWRMDTWENNINCWSNSSLLECTSKAKDRIRWRSFVANLRCGDGTKPDPKHWFT